MSFWSKFAQVASVVAPVVLSVIPGVPPIIIPLITHGIQEAELIPGASSQDKKQHVLDLVTSGIQGINIAAGHVEVDPSAVTGAVSNGIDTTIATINIVKSAQAEDKSEQK